MNTLKHPGRRYSPEEKLKIVELYNAGMPSTKIAKQLDMSFSSVLDTLKRQGIEIKSKTDRHRKYTLDENVFSSINEQSAYWVGFLMADGCVQLQRTGINPKTSLELCYADSPHVQKFSNFLKTNRPLTLCKERTNKINDQIIFSKQSCKIDIHSRQIFENLNKYGVVPNKSLTAAVSTDLAFDKHFWRGVIDGDGSVFVTKNKIYSRPMIQLIGSQMLMNQFGDFIRSEIPDFKSGVNSIRNKNIYQVTIAAKKQVLQMLDLLYTNATIYLDRKYNKAMEILNANERLLLRA